MAERGSEKMTEWLDIKLDTLSSEERIRLIEEIYYNSLYQVCVFIIVSLRLVLTT